MTALTAAEGREDGRADALAGLEPYDDAWDGSEYALAYMAAYDAALAEICPDFVRPVAS